MTDFVNKWAVRRYSPPVLGFLQKDDAASLYPQGKEQLFDTWKDVVRAADTILGRHSLDTTRCPTDPVIIKHGEDVILIHLKLGRSYA